MRNRRVDKLIEQVQTLSLKEIEQLRDTIDALLVAHHRPTEDEFERMLVETGVIGDRSAPTTAPAPDRDFAPIPVTGPPVSKTIVEERR